MVKSTRGPGGFTQRQLRVGELVRRGLAEILFQWDSYSETLSPVSITIGEVRMSPDLKKATVFVSPLGGDRMEETVTSLNESRREIRHQLNKKLTLKFSPSLYFVSDPLYDQMDNTRRLFNLDEVKRDL